MPRARIQLNAAAAATAAATVSLLGFLLLLVYLRSPPADSASPLLGQDNAAIVVPLTLSSPNSSRTLFHFRRNFKRSESNSNATSYMRLYDSLIPPGYYTVKVWIGTPAQIFMLVVDTGSTLTFVPCSTCKECGIHQDPYYQPDRSRTYRPLKCSKNCTCDSEMKHCVFEKHYFEQSSSSGVLGEDIISFGDQSEVTPQRTVFGCQDKENGYISHQLADGLMGLGRGQDSIVDQLVQKGVISNSFSICYGGMGEGGGAMILGGISPPPGMIFAHSDPARSPYYNIDLKEIHVAGKWLPLTHMVFNGTFGTILDSGTACAYLPEAAFEAFKDAIMKELNSINLIEGPNLRSDDICFSGIGSDISQLSKRFPTVDMVFGNGNKLSLSPENYLFQHYDVDGAYCLGIYQNPNDETTILGGIIVRNTLVMYDREHLKIGFWKTNCSKIWEKPHLPNFSAAKPPTSVGENSTEEVYTIPAGLIIGFIAFDMRLSIMGAEMKQYLTELTASVALGLEVDTSQVRLLNSTSKDGHSVLTWAIYPVKPSNHMSHAAAKSILAGIVKHSVKLPPMFGNYQVSNWRLGPPAKRKWWEKHWAVVTTFLLSLVGGQIALGVWFLWGDAWLSSGAYNRISHLIPEFELQPFRRFQGAVAG